MPIKINIHPIRENKSGQVAGHYHLLPPELDLPDPKEIWQPLDFDFVCTNAGDYYVLTGTIRSHTLHQCSRCLKPVAVPLAVEVQEEYSRQPAETGEDRSKISGDEIDISDALRENIILNLPTKPLCSPDCLGLCPHCGSDRNLNPCDCRPVSGDPRLASLEKLIKK